MLKPQLLPRETPSLVDLPYPLLGSPKIDGIRCLFTREGPILRSGKPIPNEHIRSVLEDHCEALHGLDGEIIAGEDPSVDGLFGKTTSLLRHHTKVGDWSIW